MEFMILHPEVDLRAVRNYSHQAVYCSVSWHVPISHVAHTLGFFEQALRHLATMLVKSVHLVYNLDDKDV